MIAQYLMVSLVPATFGILAGGGIGLAYAALISRLFWQYPAWRRWLLPIPWRAGVISPSLVLLFLPIAVAGNFGFGREAGMISVGSTFCLLAAPVIASAQLDTTFPRSWPERLAPAVRTLLVASIILGVFTSQMGASALGVDIFTGQSGITDAYHVFWLLFGMAAVLDVLLGIAQMGLLGRANIEQPASGERHTV